MTGNCVRIYSKADKLLTLKSVNLGSIPGISHGPLKLARVIPECRFRSKPRVPTDVTAKQTNKQIGNN